MSLDKYLKLYNMLYNVVYKIYLKHRHNLLISIINPSGKYRYSIDSFSYASEVMFTL